MVVTGTIIFVHTQYGLGTHVHDLSGPDDLSAFFKVGSAGSCCRMVTCSTADAPRHGNQLLYAEVIAYYLALFLIKLILCTQYYRLVGELPKYRVFCRAIMGLTTAWCIVSVFLMVFQCNPIPAFWDKTILFQPGASCHPEIYGPAATIGNIVTDFILLLLPIPVILRLKLHPGQKWLISGTYLPSSAQGPLLCRLLTQIPKRNLQHWFFVCVHLSRHPA